MLISQRTEPYVAQKRIRVMKLLRLQGENFITPYRKDIVIPNSMLEAKGTTEITDSESKHKIAGGYIHSTADFGVQLNGMDTSIIYGFESYIPKGSKFYVSQYMNEICSDKLYITDKRYSFSELLKYNFRRKMLLPLIKSLLSTIDRNNVDAGWILLSNKELIHPMDYRRGLDVHPIGIVGHVSNDGSALIIGLNSASTAYCSFDRDALSYKENETEAFCDMDGMKNTVSLANSNIYNPLIHRATKYCLCYETEGTKKGDWYLPSIGELNCMLRDSLDKINMSLALLCKGRISGMNISSTEYNDERIWLYDSASGYIYNGYKRYSDTVTPCMKLES